MVLVRFLEIWVQDQSISRLSCKKNKGKHDMKQSLYMKTK